MATKIAEAASIAAMGIDVYVVEVIYTISFLVFHYFKFWQQRHKNYPYYIL